MKPSLLLVAHGSRKQQANKEVQKLAQQLKQLDDSFEHIEFAFLEFAEPSITEGLKKLADNNVTNIIVLPYFLSAGTHVTKDIPAEVERFKAANPNLKITMAPYLGSAKEIPALLLIQAHLAKS